MSFYFRIETHMRRGGPAWEQMINHMTQSFHSLPPWISVRQLFGMRKVKRKKIKKKSPHHLLTFMFMVKEIARWQNRTWIDLAGSFGRFEYWTCWSLLMKGCFHLDYFRWSNLLISEAEEHAGLGGGVFSWLCVKDVHADYMFWNWCKVGLFQ